MIRFVFLFSLFLNWTLLAQEVTNEEVRLETEILSTEETADRGDLFSFGEVLVLSANQTARDVIILGGNAVIDGAVRGDLIVIGGSAVVNNRVRRDLVAVGAAVTLGTNASVGSDAVIVGGTFKEAPGVRINGEKVIVPFDIPQLHLKWLKDWISKGLLLGRPLPHQLPWAWVVTAIFFGVYFLTGLLLSGPVTRTANAVLEKPIMTFAVGMLGIVLLIPVIFLLIVSVVGILALPFLLCALFAACIVGKAILLQSLGTQIARQLGSSSFEKPIFAILLGGILLALFYIIPVVGFIAWGLAAVMSLGAVLLPLFTRKPREVVSYTLSAQTVPPVEPPPPISEPVPTVAPRDLQLRPAGFWLKLAGALLDLIIIIVISALVGFPPVGILVWLAYNITFWTLKGTTLGGMVVGIRAARLNGEKMNFTVALVRAFASLLSAVPLFLGYFWSAWDGRKQTWHDKIAGTVVVKVPAGVSLV